MREGVKARVANAIKLHLLCPFELRVAKYLYINKDDFRLLRQTDEFKELPEPTLNKIENYISDLEKGIIKSENIPNLF